MEAEVSLSVEREIYNSNNILVWSIMILEDDINFIIVEVFKVNYIKGK